MLPDDRGHVRHAAVAHLQRAFVEDLVAPRVLWKMLGDGHLSSGSQETPVLSEQKVAGSIPTIGDIHTVGPCKKAVFACLATDVK